MKMKAIILIAITTNLLHITTSMKSLGKIIMPTTETAYNCDKPEFEETINLRDLYPVEVWRNKKKLTTESKTWGHAATKASLTHPLWSKLPPGIIVTAASILERERIAMAEMFFGEAMRGTILVRIQNKIYLARCKKVQVIEAPHSKKCYDERRVSENGTIYFIDEIKRILLKESNEIECPKSKLSITGKIFKTVYDSEILKISNKMISFALFKSNLFFDANKFFNENATKEFVWQEEDTLAQHIPFLRTIQWFIRKNQGALYIAYVGIQVLASMGMVAIALKNGVPLIKAVALSISIVKSFVDLKNYIAQANIPITEAMKASTEDLDYDITSPTQGTAYHFMTIYKMMEKTADRLNKIDGLDQGASDGNSASSGSSPPGTPDIPETPCMIRKNQGTTKAITGTTLLTTNHRV